MMKYSHKLNYFKVAGFLIKKEYKNYFTEVVKWRIMLFNKFGWLSKLLSLLLLFTYRISKGFQSLFHLVSDDPCLFRVVYYFINCVEIKLFGQTSLLLSVFLRDGPDQTSPQIGQFSGNTALESVYSTSNQILIKFHSDFTTSGFFVLSYHGKYDKLYFLVHVLYWLLL